MQDLKTMFETIINTDFCTNLIQSLIYESMRQSRNVMQNLNMKNNKYIMYKIISIIIIKVI